MLSSEDRFWLLVLVVVAVAVGVVIVTPVFLTWAIGRAIGESLVPRETPVPGAVPTSCSDVRGALAEAEALREVARANYLAAERNRNQAYALAAAFVAAAVAAGYLSAAAVASGWGVVIAVVGAGAAVALVAAAVAAVAAGQAYHEVFLRERAKVGELTRRIEELRELERRLCAP